MCASLIYIIIKSLNIDGQQFHQYQQNEQTPLTFTHWTHKKRPWYKTLEIQVHITFQYSSQFVWQSLDMFPSFRSWYEGQHEQERY